MSGGRIERSYLTPPLVAWRRWTDAPLVVIALGSLPLLLLELARSRLVAADRMLLDGAGVVVLVAFTVDFVVELAVASDRPFYIRTEWLGILIIACPRPGPSCRRPAGGPCCRGRSPHDVEVSIVSALEEARDGLALGTAGMVWLTSAVVFTLVEDVGVHGRIRSFGDALWWSTSTITTVGYGDVAPVTAAGRIAGGITMVVGVGAFAVVTAKIAEFLVRSNREHHSNN